MEFKIGDYVYYNIVGQNELTVGSGLVLEVREDYTFIIKHSNYSKCFEKIETKNIIPVENREELVAAINEFYNNIIEVEKGLLKSVNRSDYQEDIKNKYLLLKYEILNTCANMTEDIDDCSFENKLKAICEKKKQLFSIKCEEMNDARKFNGEIKYRIREIQDKRDYQINNIDESMNKIKKSLK